MVWNYRIGKKRHEITVVDDITHKRIGTDYEDQYGIVECYYGDGGCDNDNILFTSEHFQEPYGETKEELIECLEMMLKDAKQHDVLDLDVLWKELEDLKSLETLNSKGETE